MKAANPPTIPAGDQLLTRLDMILLARARIDRKLAALRCLEAIRLYAAGHGGKLPPTLDDIKDVPVPSDPVAGKPFRYRVAGGKATLYGPAPDKYPAHEGTVVHYELTLTR
jgi:hypothetical protein